MILAGHQPEYLPYAGFFYKVMCCDKFIFVDHVQYVKKTFQNRNRIRVAHGSAGWTWLTVPVIVHGKFHQRICDVEINNSVSWQEKHWRSITLAYKNTPYFDNYRDLFEEIYSKQWTKLAALNEAIIKSIFKELNISVEILRSSDFEIFGDRDSGSTAKGTDLLIEMCRVVGADTYLSGQGAKAYVEEDRLKASNLNHRLCEFKHPAYEQRFKPFTPLMSVLDMLFNCGDRTAEIIKRAQEESG